MALPHSRGIDHKERYLELLDFAGLPWQLVSQVAVRKVIYTVKSHVNHIFRLRTVHSSLLNTHKGGEKKEKHPPTQAAEWCSKVLSKTDVVVTKVRNSITLAMASTSPCLKTPSRICVCVCVYPWMYKHQCVLRMISWVNRNVTGRRCHNQLKHYRKDRTTKQREGKVKKRENLCEARQLQHNSADFAGLLRSILLKSQESKSWLFLSHRGGQIYNISTFNRWSNVCFSSAFPLRHSPPSPVTLGSITRTLPRCLSLLVMIIWPCQQVEVTELSISPPHKRCLFCVCLCAVVVCTNLADGIIRKHSGWMRAYNVINHQLRIL